MTAIDYPELPLRPVSADPEIRRRSLRTADVLMRMALPLLDAGGDLLTAARLEHAISSLDLPEKGDMAPVDGSIRKDVDFG